MIKLYFNFTKEEKVSWLIFISSFIIYAVISMTKSAYAASIASIVEEGIFSKSQAGVINSGFYVFYGGAQLLGVKLVEKISPVKYILFSLAGTVVCIVGMALSSSFYMMLLFWCACGLIQFAIWPAELRIISEYILPELQTKAKTYIAFAYCTGMLFSYLLSAIILKFARWQMLFYTSAIILIICIIAWLYITRSTKETTKIINQTNKEYNEIKLKEISKNSVPAESNMSFGKMLFASGVILLLVPSFARSALDAGVKSWVPTMIAESYSVSPSFANMLTTILVFINLGGVFILNFFYPRYIKNETWCYGLCFLVALPFTALILLIGKVPVLVIALLLTIVTTMMYAANQLITVLIPSYFAKYNKAASVASLLNAIASFGIVISSVIYGVLAENYGWSGTIVSWIIICAVAFIACAIATPMWKKFTKK